MATCHAGMSARGSSDWPLARAGERSHPCASPGGGHPFPAGSGLPSHRHRPSTAPRNGEADHSSAGTKSLNPGWSTLPRATFAQALSYSLTRAVGTAAARRRARDPIDTQLPDGLPQSDHPRPSGLSSSTSPMGRLLMGHLMERNHLQRAPSDIRHSPSKTRTCGAARDRHPV